MKTLKNSMITLLVLTFLFFGHFNVGKSMSTINETIEQYTCKPFILLNYEKVSPNDCFIHISHKLMNALSNYKISYDTNSINIINSSMDKDGNSSLLIEPYASKAFFDVEYTNDSNMYEKYNTRIYIYSEKEYYYLSDISFEQCVLNSKRYNQPFLEDIFIFGINTCDNIEYRNNRSNNITVTGVVQWTDSATNLHIGKDIKVEVWDTEGTTDNILLAVGYTNDEGRYSFTFPNDKSSPENGYDIRVKFYSTNSYVNIVNPSSEVTYSILHPTITTDVNNDAVVTKSITIDNNTADERAFQVLQAMTMAAKYAKKMNSNIALGSVNVIFPNSSGTFYYSADEKLRILAADYCDWDVMQHEYGHYIRDSLTSTVVKGGEHSLNVNLIDYYLVDNTFYSDLKNDKINLAWSEGWATYFAIACQMDCNASTLNIPNVGDEKYEDTIDSSTIYNLESGNLELPSGNIFYSLGEANEAAIMSILYDFLDGTNESFDYVQYTHQQIWDNTMNNSVTNLSEFINQYNNESNNQRIKIGRILSKYGAASNTLTNPSVINTEVPTFTWTPGGGSTNMPNNRFRIVFYSPNYVQLLEKSNLTVATYTLTESEWTSILSHNYNYVYWVIYAEQTNTPTTGAYISEPNTLNMPATTSLSMSTTVSHTLGTGDYYWYKFTAFDNGTYTFETTGSTDTYGELFPSLVAGHSTTGRLAYNDDGGENHNFKIVYNLTAGQTVYIRIRGYAWTSTGQFSFEITGPNHTHNYTYTWVDYNQHRWNCICGVTGLQVHIVSPEAYNNGQQYAECTLCHGQAYIGSIYNKGSNPSFPTTFNGSFILPNGVIVLEDLDMDAYLDGTLVFKYHNNSLLSSKTNIHQYLKKKENILCS